MPAVSHLLRFGKPEKVEDQRKYKIALYILSLEDQRKHKTDPDLIK